MTKLKEVCVLYDFETFTFLPVTTVGNIEFHFCFEPVNNQTDHDILVDSTQVYISCAVAKVAL